MATATKTKQRAARPVAANETTTKPTGVTLSDDEIDARITDLDERDRQKLVRFTDQALSRQGYANVRDGSATWQRVHRQVMRDIIQAGMTIADIEEGE